VRGTAARGTKFRHAVYKQLGHYEAIDQTEVARYVLSLTGRLAGFTCRSTAFVPWRT